METHFWPLFCPKIGFFLRYTHITPFFGLRRAQLNGIITSPYPEATLDTFGFPVGAHLAARRAVLGPWLPKRALFEAKNAVFWTEIHFLETPSNFFVTIMTGHKNNNLFVLTVLQGGLLWGAMAYFWPKKGKKSDFLTLHPFNPPFLRSDGPNSMGP